MYFFLRVRIQSAVQQKKVLVQCWVKSHTSMYAYYALRSRPSFEKHESTCTFLLLSRLKRLSGSASFLCLMRHATALKNLRLYFLKEWEELTFSEDKLWLWNQLIQDHEMHAYPYLYSYGLYSRPKELVGLLKWSKVPILFCNRDIGHTLREFSHE